MRGRERKKIKRSIREERSKRRKGDQRKEVQKSGEEENREERSEVR